VADSQYSDLEARILRLEESIQSIHSGRRMSKKEKKVKPLTKKEIKKAVHVG